MTDRAADAATPLPRGQWALIGSLLLAVMLANIDQPYPELAPLQHAPTVLLCLAAPWLLRRWPLSTGSVALLWLFLLLHTLGGRYIYSYVPYQGWLAAVSGEALGGLLVSSRNGYDRMVHFMFGLLFTPIFAEISRRHGGIGPRASWLLGFALIGLGSALYEVFEWLLTVVAAGETADYYNGQQGDVWDPQKDMGLAQLGSLIAWIMCTAAGRRRT
jgi:putative membrane protein